MRINNIKNFNFYGNKKAHFIKNNSIDKKKNSKPPSLVCLELINKPFVNCDNKKYFLDKYGIIVELDNIEQAKILDSAINEFTRLDYYNKNQKLFEGLKVSSRIDELDTLYAALYSKLIIPMSHYQLTNEKALSYIKNLDDEDIGFEYLQIDFNNNCNVENFYSKISKNDGKYAFSDLKFALVHELSHWLYAVYRPRDFAIGSIIEPIFNPKLEEEKEIISQVSKYGTLNINEFIAEYIAGRLSGKNYPKEVDKLYKQYNGIELFC